MMSPLSHNAPQKCVVLPELSWDKNDIIIYKKTDFFDEAPLWEN